MKKIIFSLLLLACVSVNAQTVDEVIGKYAANLGGLDAFNKITTAKMTGIYTIQGMDLPLTVQVINGKAVRSDVEAMGSKVINAYKDGKGWKQNPFAGSPSSTDATSAELSDLKIQVSLAPVLINYKALGHKAELLGQEDVDGVKTYKIKLTFKDDGKVTTYYIGVKDFILIKSESEREIQGQTAKVESYYSDLKEFNGVKFFMTRDQKIDGQVFQTTKLESIELNVPIDEKIFDKPKE